MHKKLCSMLGTIGGHGQNLCTMCRAKEINWHLILLTHV